MTAVEVVRTRVWVDYCGAMMINGRKATGVDATRVLLGHLSAPRTAPGKVYGVPVGETYASRFPASSIAGRWPGGPIITAHPASRTVMSRWDLDRLQSSSRKA